MTAGALRHPDVRELAPAGGWASLGLALRLGKIDLRHFVVVRIDELLRIRIGTDLLRERQEGGTCPRRPRRWLRQRRGGERAPALLQLADLRFQLLAALGRGADLRAEPLDARVESFQLFVAIFRSRGERQGSFAERHVDAQDALPVSLDREQGRGPRLLAVRVRRGIVAPAEHHQIHSGSLGGGEQRLRRGDGARAARMQQ